MELDEAKHILNQNGYELLDEWSSEDNKTDKFADEVKQELASLCNQSSKDYDLDPEEVFDTTYAFYREMYPELSARKLAKWLIARYRYKQKWKDFSVI